MQLLILYNSDDLIKLFFEYARNSDVHIEHHQIEARRFGSGLWLRNSLLTFSAGWKTDVDVVVNNRLKGK